MGCHIVRHADHASRPIQVPCHRWCPAAVVSFHGEQLAQAQLELPDCMPLERSWVAARWEGVKLVRALSEDQGMTALC